MTTERPELLCHCGRCGELTLLQGPCEHCGAGFWTQVFWTSWWVGIPAGFVVLLNLLALGP